MNLEEIARTKVLTWYSSKIIVGVENTGAPVIIKILSGEKSKMAAESDAIQTILEHREEDDHLVCGRLDSIYIPSDAHSGTFKYSDRNLVCFITPMYPLTAAKLPKLPEDVLLKGGRQMISAISKIHRCGLVHMDIKPANIFLDMQGCWFLGDFGSCVPIDGTVHEYTPMFLPSNFIGKQAKPILDKYMLAVTLVCLSLESAHWQDKICGTQQIVDHDKLIALVKQFKSGALRDVLQQQIDEEVLLI